MRDYVKEFNSLTLDIKNMSEEDKLFNLMSDLQPWAQVELRMRIVLDIPFALAATKRLVDYQYNSFSGSHGDGKKGNNGKSNKGSRSKDGQKNGKKNMGENS